MPNTFGADTEDDVTDHGQETVEQKARGDICNELHLLSSDGIKLGVDNGAWAKAVMREAASEIAKLRSKIIILEIERDAKRVAINT